MTKPKTKKVEEEDIHEPCKQEIAELIDENECFRDENEELLGVIREIESLLKGL